jgi:hypothetical protein
MSSPKTWLIAAAVACFTPLAASAATITDTFADAFWLGTTAPLIESLGVLSQITPPSVPDGGETVVLLGLGLIALGVIRYLIKR